MGSRGRRCATRLLFLLAMLTGCAAGGGGGGAAGSSGEPAPSGAATPGAVGVTEPAAAAVPLTPAVFTAPQAERGRRVFGRVCSVCHGRNEFRGPIFALTWVEEPVGHLFQHISTTMPQDRPGSLSLDEYASVVAYLLDLNGRPAGDQELPADVEALNRMRW